jgi:ABC-2 type transport system permease protein
MDKFFAKRRATWYKQNLKYLRYVFNDHFVLVIFILLGYLAYQYAQLLKVIPQNWLPGKCAILIIAVILLVVGKVPTYLETPDKLFLLPKEQQVMAHIKKMIGVSMVLPTILIVLAAFITAPLARVSLSFSGGLLIAFWGVVWLLKLLVQIISMGKCQEAGRLNWQLAIDLEAKRRERILVVYSQFVNVKGLTAKAKRRAYLDPLLGQARQTYDYILRRTFMRSGDYLGLSLRLIVVGSLAIYFIGANIVGLAVGVLFQFLLLFQLIGLQHALDGQLLARLYPKQDKTKAVKQIIGVVLGVMTLAFMVAMFLSDLSLSAFPIGLVVSAAIFQVIYLTSKLKSDKLVKLK